MFEQKMVTLMGSQQWARKCNISFGTVIFKWWDAVNFVQQLTVSNFTVCFTSLNLLTPISAEYGYFAPTVQVQHVTW